MIYTLLYNDAEFRILISCTGFEFTQPDVLSPHPVLRAALTLTGRADEVRDLPYGVNDTRNGITAQAES